MQCASGRIRATENRQVNASAYLQPQRSPPAFPGRQARSSCNCLYITWLCPISADRSFAPRLRHFLQVRAGKGMVMLSISGGSDTDKGRRRGSHFASHILTSCKPGGLSEHCAKHTYCSNAICSQKAFQSVVLSCLSLCGQRSLLYHDHYVPVVAKALTAQVSQTT